LNASTEFPTGGGKSSLISASGLDAARIMGTSMVLGFVRAAILPSLFIKNYIDSASMQRNLSY
jgi:hypothetical protein